MGNVGFPQGLPITRQKIAEQLQGQTGHIFDSRLVVLLRGSNDAIGECKLGRPTKDGIASTDVKLLPQYWGNKYGVEIKQALVDYLFTHTSCAAVEATPNVENVASIKMQEAVGGVRVGEATFQVPETMRHYMVPVHHYIYRVYREDWEVT
jgi:RimJ/RimL family protein N-acetyltransferase